MASEPLEQADVMQRFGPFSPRAIETCDEAISVIIMGTRNGCTLFGPWFSSTLICSKRVVRPPIPLPITTPMLSWLPEFTSNPACSTAGGDGQLSKAVHAAGILTVDMVGGFEPFYFAGDFGFKGLGVEQGNVIDTRLAVDKAFPGGGCIQAKRTQHTDTSDYNSVIEAVGQPWPPFAHLRMSLV